MRFNEIYRRSSFYNPMDYERREQRAMDADRRAFKRAELQHELGHEDDPNWQRQMRQQEIDRDRGPWYIKINGKLLKSKGEVKVFDWKRGANNYALAILKNKPELDGKIFLTKKAQDDEQSLAEDGDRYSEILAKKVFSDNPNLDSSGRADELLDVGYKYAVDDLGRKRAAGIFRYDEDFPSDFVSAYSWLQKNSDNSLEESATAGATSAANVSIGPTYKNKPAKAAKNPDGTVKNAQDMKGTNLITGGSIGKQSFIKR